MKTQTWIILLILTGSSLAGQNYYVINVKGEVFAGEKRLQTKDRVDPTMKLRFDSPEAYAYVMSPGKGYYVLSPKRIRSEKANELVLSIKDALLPPDEFKGTLTRSVGSNRVSFVFEDEFDLKAFFRDKVLVIEQTLFTVNPEAYVQDEDHFFQLELELPDSRILKDLSAGENQFGIDRNVFRAGGAFLSPDSVRAYTLYYCNADADERESIGTFTLHLLSREAVWDQLRMLREAVKPIEKEAFFFQHARPFLTTNYGSTNPNVIWEMIESGWDEE